MSAAPDRGAIAWRAEPLTALDATAVYALLRLRAAVFVLEQACAYLDPDGLDLVPGALQLLGCARDGALLACARLLPPGVAFPEPSIGRVVVAREARGRGIAHALMREALALCERHWPGQPIVIGAQQYLTGFYAGHGFVVEAEPYLEDGIPHVHMRRG